MPVQIHTLGQAVAFGQLAQAYRQLRQQHPTVRALTVGRYLRNDFGLTFEQFACDTEIGHDWVYSGAAYGGDDYSYLGEGRCYCCLCGADGDA